MAGPRLLKPMSDTSNDTLNSAASGSTPTDGESKGVRVMSERSGLPRSDSRTRWPKPRSVREFAAQVNTVATAVLNGDIAGEQLMVARLYASLARSVAQAMTTEVNRARLMSDKPSLSLDEAEDG